MAEFNPAWLMMNKAPAWGPKIASNDVAGAAMAGLLPPKRPVQRVPSPQEIKIKQLADVANQGLNLNSISEMTKQLPPSPQNLSSSISVAGNFLAPEEKEPYQALRKRLEDLRVSAKDDNKAELDILEKQYKQKLQTPVNVDLRPLAALIDNYAGTNTVEALSFNPPETVKDHEQALSDLRKQIQGVKGYMNKEEMANLKEQLKSYQDIIKLRMSEARADRRSEMDALRQQGTWGRFQYRMVENLSKRMEDVPQLIEKVGRISYILPESGAIPGVGVGESAFQDFMKSEKGRAIYQDATGIVQALLKIQSGVAVAEPEAQRKMKEYGVHPAATEETFRRGLKNLFDELYRKAEAIEAGYSTDVKDLFRNQGGMMTGEIRKLVAPSIQRSKLGSEGGEVSGGAATGPHGPTVIQNGFEYKWNKETGQYE